VHINDRNTPQPRCDTAITSNCI